MCQIYVRLGRTRMLVARLAKLPGDQYVSSTMAVAVVVAFINMGFKKFVFLAKLPGDQYSA